MSGKRPRIPLNPAQGGLGNPFGGLPAAGLPAGTEPAAPVSAKRKLGRLVLRREKSGRAGKTVIVVDGFAPDSPADLLERLAKVLRNSCSCGSTIKESAIEVQGDQAEKVREALVAEGFIVDGVR